VVSCFFFVCVRVWFLTRAIQKEVIYPNNMLGPRSVQISEILDTIENCIEVVWSSNCPGLHLLLLDVWCSDN